MHFVAQALQQGGQRASTLYEFAVAFYESASFRGEFDPLRIVEVLVMQPCVAREPRELRPARPLVLEAQRRGAHGRILYPHTARGDSGARAHLGEHLPAGGQVRTTKEVSDRFPVFDRKTAFIPSGRVGMSERTLRCHVATAMQDLSASSRFQAGVLAARTGLVDLTLRSAA